MQIHKRDFMTRLIRTRTLVCASALFLAGCLLQYALALSTGALWAFLAFLAFCGACLAPIKRMRRWIAPVLILTLLPLGALRFSSQWNALSPLPALDEVNIEGRIAQTPVWDMEAERTICVLDGMRIDGAPVEGRLRLYLRGDIEALQCVTLGQSIRCTARIWRARGSTNPGQFNFSNYLRLNGMRGYATAKIEDAQLSDPILRAGDLPERIREAFGARIDRLFNENAAIARAFLLGDRSSLSQEERENYARSGAAHILAISGMHISVLAAALNLLFSRFLRRNTAFGITLALILAYGALIGFPASLTRAVLMFAILGFAPVAGRYSDPFTRLAASMLLYLIIRPISAIESGFILSYGACAGIFLLNAPLERLFHLDGYLHKHTGVGFVNLLCNRLPHWILSTLVVTLCAQLAILPAVIHFFGAQPLCSFAVNLLAVPLAMFAYLLAIPGAILGIAPVASASDFLFGLLSECVQFFGRLPFASLRVARFPLWLVLICAVSCIAASDLTRLNVRLRKILPFTVVLAVFVSNFCSMLSTRGCSVVFLDAGQADCAILRAQGKVYLMDTGNSYSPIGDYLSGMNYKVEGVFLSHPHLDHAGGLAEVLSVCTPKNVYISENWPRYEADECVAEALALAQEKGSEIVMLSAGMELQLSDAINLQVLSPTAGFPADMANDDSLILRVNYGDASALFCGDASAATAEACATDVDLLKVGHHGASDALNAQLITELSPSVAVIPVGENNYGHPADKTLRLLEAAQTRVLRTDQSGAICCRLMSDGTLKLRSDLKAEDSNGLE